MECRQTGEFAHRETTTYEHVETFNNEVVLYSLLCVMAVIGCG